MFVYATLMLGKFNCVHQRSGLAVAGFMGVIMGIVVSYGICSAFGVFFGPMHSVLPFLLLGIGLDDMFVIAQSWDSLEIGQVFTNFPNTNFFLRNIYLVHLIQTTNTNLECSQRNFVYFILSKYLQDKSFK